MRSWIVTTAAWLGATGVILGALGAHALKKVLAPEMLASFEIGVRYQLLHAVALLGLAGIAERVESPWIRRVGVLWSVGAVFFAGSVYLLACREWLGIPGLKALGPITPLGGLLMILGWLGLLWIGRVSRK